MDINDRLIGSILKGKRLTRGFTKREDAAKLLGISAQMLGHLETDYSKPTFKTLLKMSEVYECTIAELCGESQSEPCNTENNYIDSVIDMLKKDGTLKGDANSLDDLDSASKQMLLAALNKYLLSSLKNKDSDN